MLRITLHHAGKIYNVVLSLADHTQDQFLLKFHKHFQCLKPGGSHLSLYNSLWNFSSIGSYIIVVYIGRCKLIYEIEYGFILFSNVVHSINFKSCSCLLIGCEPTKWIGVSKKRNQCIHHGFSTCVFYIKFVLLGINMTIKQKWDFALPLKASKTIETYSPPSFCPS